MARENLYSKAEQKSIERIAGLERDQWNEKITEFVEKYPERGYGAVYTKVNRIANSKGNKSPTLYNSKNVRKEQEKKEQELLLNNSSATLSPTKLPLVTLKPNSYSEEQTKHIMEIAASPRDTWSSKIHAYLTIFPGKSYTTIWQKINMEAMRIDPKNAPNPTRSAAVSKSYDKRRPELKDEAGALTRKNNKRQHQPPTKLSHMTVSNNEIRFPIKSMRIDAGHLIIAFTD